MSSSSAREAGESFVRRLGNDHGDALFRWALGRFADRRDAEEVVAETLVKAWRNHRQFDPGRGSERSWVFGIARNTAVDHYRRSKRHLRAVPAEDEPADEWGDAPIDQVAESSLVRDALMDLSHHHRQTLVHAYFEGSTVTEISEGLGIPPGTVKSRLYYGMRALRAALEERGVLQ